MQKHRILLQQHKSNSIPLFWSWVQYRYSSKKSIAKQNELQANVDSCSIHRLRMRDNADMWLKRWQKCVEKSTFAQHY